MTKCEKRLDKIRRNPKHVSNDDVEQTIMDYGFARREGKGSHTVYQHRDEDTPLVVATHGKAVPVYIVKQALAVIDRVIERETSDDSEND
jgi:predicted RNA binding protein YcfA (HicA-like mRNA interferase family)